MSIAKGIALITGSAQGLGRSIALRLAKDGFDVALNDVSSKRKQLLAVADDIEKIGQKVHIVPANVTVEEEVRGMVQDAVRELGGLDVMVANAGICERTALVDVKLDEWERVMTVNARGPFLCYKYAAQQMIKQGRGGRIIGASSLVGKTSLQFLSAYSASKFAVRGLTQAAALELGSYNITVNSYAPGAISTPMMTEGLAKTDPKVFESWKGRMAKSITYDGQPEDIASIVSYLASKEAHFITGKSHTLIILTPNSLIFPIVPGQCISVDGGIVLS